MKARRLAVVVAFVVLVFATSVESQQVQSQAIDEWSKMPGDSVITFFGTGGSAGYFDDFMSFLASNNISHPEGWSGLGGVWPSRTTDPIAPHGTKVIDGATTFIFAEPTYAVGVTLVSTSDWNAGVGVQTLSAYDQYGNLIGTAKGSSLEEKNGPYISEIDLVGRLFISSYAGIWSNVPIGKITLGGTH
jgi:hypothetical protein